jgi:cytochrome c1
MVRWLMHPQQVLPGTQMPDLGLTDDQARKIAAYLHTLNK